MVIVITKAGDTLTEAVCINGSPRPVLACMPWLPTVKEVEGRRVRGALSLSPSQLLLMFANTSN